MPKSSNVRRKSSPPTGTGLQEWVRSASEIHRSDPCASALPGRCGHFGWKACAASARQKIDHTPGNLVALLSRAMAGISERLA